MPEFLLDTNAFRELLVPGSPIAEHILANTESIFLSSVVVREILRGAMAAISEAEGRASRGKATLVKRYGLLELILSHITLFQILPYSESAEGLYQTWPKSLQRIGPNDCRIAASAVVSGMVVITRITRNTRDFVSNSRTRSAAGL